MIPDKMEVLSKLIHALATDCPCKYLICQFYLYDISYHCASKSQRNDLRGPEGMMK